MFLGVSQSEVSRSLTAGSWVSIRSAAVLTVVSVTRLSHAPAGRVVGARRRTSRSRRDGFDEKAAVGHTARATDRSCEEPVARVGDATGMAIAGEVMLYIDVNATAG